MKLKFSLIFLFLPILLFCFCQREIPVEETQYGKVTGFVYLITDTTHQNSGGISVVVTDGKFNYTKTTNNNGSYLIEQIPVGDYKIKFSKSAYLTEVQLISISANQTTNVPTDTLFLALYGESGTVKGKATLLGETNHSGIVVSIRSSEATTDVAGNYEIKSVPVGRQTLLAIKSGYQPVSIDTIMVFPNSTKTIQDIVLKKK